MMEPKLSTVSPKFGDRCLCVFSNFLCVSKTRWSRLRHDAAKASDVGCSTRVGMTGPLLFLALEGDANAWKLTEARGAGLEKWKVISCPSVLARFDLVSTYWIQMFQGFLPYQPLKNFQSNSIHHDLSAFGSQKFLSQDFPNHELPQRITVDRCWQNMKAKWAAACHLKSIFPSSRMLPAWASHLQHCCCRGRTAILPDGVRMATCWCFFCFLVSLLLWDCWLQLITQSCCMSQVLFVFSWEMWRRCGTSIINWTTPVSKRTAGQCKVFAAQWAWTVGTTAEFEAVVW